MATGFYSFLLALYEHPDAKIIVSGIGLVEGGHFYTSKDSYGYVSERSQRLIKEGKNLYKINLEIHRVVELKDL